MILLNPPRGSASRAPGAGRTEPSVVGGMVHSSKRQIKLMGKKLEAMNITKIELNHLMYDVKMFDPKRAQAGRPGPS